MDNPVLWTLIGIQVFMGAFDTLYHHEGTERLAWRASQKNELRLHGVRNIFYALIFLCFGWFEPHGIFTIVLILILVVEVFITLWDFVEEDLTRKLPATERVNHTLLALNYGAILALAAPTLYNWATMETSIALTNYGWWSIFASVSAFGVFAFGVRDLLAAARSERLYTPDADHLVTELIECKRILITGGTGFIGTRLVEALVAGGHQVTVLTRNKSHAETLDAPLHLVTNLEQIPNDQYFDTIINLAGDPIANGLWSEKPECWISGSAIGWYGLYGNENLTEASSANDCFVHEVCERWETEAQLASDLGIRLVTLRLGLVLGVEGGLLAKLLTPFEFGLGGPMGSGQHWMSWIALDDVVRMIAYVIAEEEITGPINATAPNPVKNETFTKALGKSLNRPSFLRVPAYPLKFILGDLARETMLGGQKVLPEKITKAGFRFLYSDITKTLKVITGAK